MKRRKRKSLLSTSLAVYLSLNVQIQRDDGENQLLTFPLLQLATWLMVAWQLKAVLYRPVEYVEAIFNRLDHWLQVQQAEFKPATIMAGIGIRSLLYGLGVMG